jgi:hypothetical protein
MKRIHVIGIAFAAILVFSMVSASGASAFTLWDLCMEIELPAEKGLFNDNNCLTLGGTEDWEWLEIIVATKIDSLPTTLTLSSNGTTIDCKGTSVGTIGPGAGGTVTVLLTEAGEEITELAPVTCELLVAGLCSAPVTASPVGLPWLTSLTTSNDLLEGTSSPGWAIKCNNGVSNTCTRADTLLTVENLTDELEVDLGFKKLENASCTIGTGTVEGTVSILDEELPEGAIQAM